MRSTRDSLPPYGEFHTCPKCGKYPKTTWHSGAVNKGFPCYDTVGVGEHMCRVCSNCGYGWMEAPLDANAEEEEASR